MTTTETTTIRPARPCTACHTTGGDTMQNVNRPARLRGLCRACYDHHRHFRTLPTSWPAPEPWDWERITPERTLAGTLQDGATLDLRPFRLPVPPQAYPPVAGTRLVRHAPWIVEGLAFLAETDRLTLADAA